MAAPPATIDLTRDHDVQDLCDSDEDDAASESLPKRLLDGQGDDGPPTKRCLRSGPSAVDRSKARTTALGHSLTRVTSGKFYLVDTETTDKYIESSEIIQMSVVNICDPGDKLVIYVMPEGDIDEGATKVHKLTKDILLEKGAVSFREAWDMLITFVNPVDVDHIYMVGHNVYQFDEPLLRRMVKKHDLVPSYGENKFQQITWIDTLELAHQVIPDELADGRSLKKLYQRACDADFKAHDAFEDCVACSHVWSYLVDLKYNTPYDDYARSVLDFPRGPRLGPFAFGSGAWARAGALKYADEAQEA